MLKIALPHLPSFFKLIHHEESILTDLTDTGGLSYAYGLIGESYLKKGSRQLAIIYFEKAAALDSENKHAKGMLDELLSKK